MTAFRILKLQAGYVGFSATARGLRHMNLPEPARAMAIARIKAVDAAAVEDVELLPAFAEELSRYFMGERVRFTVRLDWSDCTEFEQSVWRACAKIGFGKTASYADLARSIGNPKAARAIGMAMGRNRCPVVIPCHRILRSDGSIGGYSGPGGVDRKRELLMLEAGRAEKLFV